LFSAASLKLWNWHTAVSDLAAMPLLLLVIALAWLCQAALGFAVRIAPNVRVVYDPRQSEHVARYEHPECPARTAAAAELLSSIPGIEMHKPSCCDTSEELAKTARAKALRYTCRQNADCVLRNVYAKAVVFALQLRSSQMIYIAVC
jgi:hypothetical protein